MAVSTELEPPVTDSDKSWRIYHNEPDDTCRFQSNSSRFLYHQVNGDVTHLNALETDARSKWQLIEIEIFLSVSNSGLEIPSIKVHPDPAKEGFFINFQNIDKSKKE